MHRSIGMAIACLENVCACQRCLSGQKRKQADKKKAPEGA